MEYKLIINGGDLKPEWTSEQFETVVESVLKLAEDLDLGDGDLLITGFNVKGRTVKLK